MTEYVIKQYSLYLSKKDNWTYNIDESKIFNGYLEAIAEFKDLKLDYDGLEIVEVSRHYTENIEVSIKTLE